MAYRFRTGGTTDALNLGSAASLDNLGPFTVWLWAKLNVLNTISSRVISKMTLSGTFPGWNIQLDSVSGGQNTILADMAFSTAYAESRSSEVLVVGNWNFIAVSWASRVAGFSPQIYQGSQKVSVHECDYRSRANGVGTVKDDSAENMWLGNGNTGATRFDGDIAVVGVVNRVLSVGELASLQKDPRAINGTVGYWDFGKSIQDLTGVQGAPTVTGAVLVPQPSVWFPKRQPFERWMVSGGASAILPYWNPPLRGNVQPMHGGMQG